MMNRLPLLTLGLLPVLGWSALPEGRPAESPGLTASLATAPGMRGLVYSFFEEQTGRRIGRLRIDSAEVEYGRQGFLRVAWRPLVVLSGVTLDAGEISDWRAAGAQIIDALKVAGQREAFVMRSIRLRLKLADGTLQEVTAGQATLRADGAMELHDATVADGTSAVALERGTLLLWLAGPQTGQLTAGSAAAAGPALSQFSPETSDPIAR